MLGRARALGLFALTLWAVVALVAAAPAALRGAELPFPSALRPSQAFSPFAWLQISLEGPARLTLSKRALPSLARYLRASENHTPDWRAFLEGPYGPRNGSAFRLSWSGDTELEPAFVPVDRLRPCPHWEKLKPVRVVRYVGESAYLSLLDCDGSVPADVLDRVSALARAPNAPRPVFPLPPEPVPGAENGEWSPGLHLLHPRLIWALSRIGEAFPGHDLVIMSGYRPDAHTSLHRSGRALDLYVAGVPHEALYRVCHSLRDVGCGFYPSGKFVHIDVRPFGTGHVEWVDLSRPGEPSEYADGWPGLIEPGSAWLGPNTAAQLR
jgi:hypothetical protein